MCHLKSLLRIEPLQNRGLAACSSLMFGNGNGYEARIGKGGGKKPEDETGIVALTEQPSQKSVLHFEKVHSALGIELFATLQ